MRLTLIDLFIDHDVVLWCKDADGDDVFLRDDFCPTVHFRPRDKKAADIAKRTVRGALIEVCRRQHLSDGEVSVLRLTFPSVADYQRRFKALCDGLAPLGVFFDCDTPLEERYLLWKGITPFSMIDAAVDEGRIVSLHLADDLDALDYPIPLLRVLRLEIKQDRGGAITSVTCNGLVIDEDIPSVFTALFTRLDPDVIVVHKQQGRLLKLLRWCAQERGRPLHLNRYGEDLLDGGEGYSFLSYGVRHYRERPLFLRGRLLINTGSSYDESFTLHSLIEGARVCRMRLQMIATHSVGRAVTNLLVHQAAVDGYLVPARVGITERLKTFGDLIDCDRGALTLEPYVGMHRDVCELDFVSMYPSIISSYNLSPETLYCTCCTEKIPGTPYHFCRRQKGIVPKVCDLLLSRRLAFKDRDDQISHAKVGYLKWLLVVIFGFQAYKNKKIGSIEVHEAINAVARETLLLAMRVAEERGFEVVHGIVDSLYVKKKDITDEDGRLLAKEIAAITSLPIEHKNTYRFITFLPSVVNPSHPVPTSYYGVGEDGSIKVRGIALRQRSAPRLVKTMQSELITLLGHYREGAPLDEFLGGAVRVLRRHLEALDHATVDDLIIKVRIGRERYKVDCPQRQVVERLASDGVVVRPGQSVSYVIEDFSSRRYVPSRDFSGRFDRQRYAHLLKRGFLHLFLPFGLTLSDVEDLLAGERQQSLLKYTLARTVATP